MKVSVIIPVYNAENYLEQCLESVCSQSVRDIEVLCVDDGSADASLSILRRAAKKDPRIRVLTQENRGGGAARNLALSEASGEYAAFLDADDYWEPEMLKKMCVAADRTRADVCVCKARRWHEDLKMYTELPGAMREELMPEKEVFSRADMPEGILNAFHNWPWNKLFRRAFLEKKGIVFQELHRTNDLLFTCRALVQAERIAAVREQLVNYRVGTRLSCQDTNRQYPLDFFEAFSALREFLYAEGCFAEVEKSYLNHALDGCIANLISQEGGASQERLYAQLKERVIPKLGLANLREEDVHGFNRENYEALKILRKEDYPAFLRFRIASLKEERDRIMHLELEIYDSFTWKVGRVVSAPLRRLARLRGPRA